MERTNVIIGVDPGPKGKGCGIAVMDGDRLIVSGVHEPQVMIPFMANAKAVVIEMISCYGMAVGMSTFETLLEAGRIVQAALEFGTPVYLIPRQKIKLVVCGTSQAKDKNVRAAVIDSFLPTGGGKIPQIGTKKEPGPLYGVSKHAWPAIAAVFCLQRAGDERGIDVEEYRYTQERWGEFVVEDGGA